MLDDDRKSKGDLGDIPYEIESPLDDKYFIDQHSALYNIFIYFYILFFYGFSVFIIYRAIHFPILDKQYYLTESCKNFESQQCIIKFAQIPFKNAHLKIYAELYPIMKHYYDLDALFNISTFPTKHIYSDISFSNLTNQKDKTENSLTVFEHDILNIKFINIQCYFSTQIHNFSEIKLTVEISSNYNYNFMLYCYLYFAFTALLFILIKIHQLTKLDDIKLNQFIPLIFLCFCLVSSFSIFLLDHNHSSLVQKISNAYLSTLYFEISFSFIFFTIYSLPFNFLESFFDFFLSILILLYSFLFQIFRMHTRQTNPNVFLALLYVTYVLRNLQKGYFWFIIRSKQTLIRSIVYTIINLITTSILFFCHYSIATKENKQIFLLCMFISLISYSITMVIYNSP